MSAPAADLPRDPRVRDAAGLALAAFLGAKCALLVALALRVQWIMDELNVIGFTQDVGEFYSAFDPIRTVLFAYYWLPSKWLASNSVEMITLARLQAVLLTLALLALAAMLATRLGLGRREAALSAAILASFTNFMEYGFNVRPDTLAVVFGFLAWWVALGGTSARRLLGAGLLLGAAFLSTQKAAYMALALGLGLVAAALLRRSLRAALTEGALLVAGFVVATGLYAVAFGGADALGIVRLVFTSPMSLALDVHEHYTEFPMHVTRTVVRNALLFMGCAAGLVLAARELRRASRPLAAAWVATVVLTALVFTHRQPWPYVFVMVLPALAPWAARLVARAEVGRRDVVVLAVVVLLAPTFYRNFRYFRLDNSRQARVMQHAEALLGPEDRYFDGIGMLGTRRQSARAWWDTPSINGLIQQAWRGDSSTLDTIFAGEPKVVIMSYRTVKVAQLLEPLLADSYVQVAPNVLLAGAPVLAEERRFDCPWTGLYDLRSAIGVPVDAAFLLDDVEVRGPVRIARGAHRLRALAQGRETWIVPADAPPPRVELGPPRRFGHLFEGVYDF